MRIMYSAYIKIIFSLILTLNYFLSRLKPTMARHSHHHHHFQDIDCFRCPPGFGVHQNCTLEQDTECSPCQSGFYSSHYSAYKPCYPCSLCGVGLYIAHMCIPQRDTICDSCHTYKGPHNEDYYQKCLKPLQERTNQNTSAWREENNLSSEPMKSRSLEVPYPVIVICATAIGALTAVLVVTCLVSWTKNRNKKMHSRYPYQAVATQEAVML